MQGVDGIVHTASPVRLDADDPNELIAPALNGTLGVLRSTLAHGSSVRRIVITSSSATIVSQSTVPQVYNENSWNDAAVQEVQEKGREATQMVKYRASKTLAEKAAWEFYEKNKSSILWDIAVINPPWVLGPILHAVSSPKALNESMREWYTAVCDGGRDKEALANVGSVRVDVAFECR